MSIHEPLPQLVSAGLVGVPVLSCRADVDEEGRFGDRWLVVTVEEVLVAAPDGRMVRRVPVGAVTGARADVAVGGGLLLAETADGPVVLVRYTAAEARKFVLAARVLTALATGEELPTVSARDLPRTCPTCGRPLLEGTKLCAVCVDKGRVVSRLLSYTKPYRLQMVAAAVMLGFATLMELVPPYLMKVIVDDVLQPKSFGTALLWLVLSLLGARIVLAVLQTLRGYIGVWVGSKVMGDVRRDAYRSLMRLSLSFFDRRQTSQFIGRVNSDSDAMRQFLTDGVVWLVGQVVMLVAVVAMMVQLSPRLALLALLPTPLVIIGSLLIWPYVRHKWYRHWRSILRIHTLVGDALQGIRVVKAFGQESQEKDRYKDANEDLVQQTTRAEGAWHGVFPAFSLLTGSGALLVWFFGGWSVLRDELTLGTLMAFNAYLMMFFGPLQWFSQMMSWTSRAMAAADRVFEIMDTQPDVADAYDAVAAPRIEGAVVLEQVTFGYERHVPVVKEIELSVAAGEMIGLVGHSGAGKSTLINLICRFYDPDQGRITIDGVDLRMMKQEDLRRQIGVVLQETFLFDGSVADNIAYSKPGATPEEIMRAAKIANAHDFIVKMPDGYDTRVGERGHRLSGGEKQRVAIARAILHDPRILILDEATASVDAETERQIQEAIARLVEGRTTFAIAHRLSTLRNAHRLVALDKGRVAEVGTHQELLDRQGIYYKLVEAQRETAQVKGVDG